MELVHKRLALGLAVGLGMSFVVWLNLSEASPLFAYLMQNPRVGHSLLVLNLPALFVSRLLSGTPPSAIVVYSACFVQWFALGIGLSFALWPRTAQAASS